MNLKIVAGLVLIVLAFVCVPGATNAELTLTQEPPRPFVFTGLQQLIANMVGLEEKDGKVVPVWRHSNNMLISGTLPPPTYAMKEYLNSANPDSRWRYHWVEFGVFNATDGKHALRIRVRLIMPTAEELSDELFAHLQKGAYVEGYVMFNSPPNMGERGTVHVYGELVLHLKKIGPTELK